MPYTSVILLVNCSFVETIFGVVGMRCLHVSDIGFLKGKRENIHAISNACFGLFVDAVEYQEGDISPCSN